jgi:hypothetical protein
MVSASLTSSAVTPRFSAAPVAAQQPVVVPQMSTDTANFIKAANGQPTKSPAQRTMSGLKNAAAEIGWTTLWSLLTLKGTVFCCGLLGWPFAILGILSAGKALGKFKDGYNR